MEEDAKMNPKVSGYLEKKGKKKMMSTYKKYWFVLEGRLLLYYRSKDEYEAISPCKGSINLGPPCNVKPCSSSHGVFQIETRTNTITLRAENREDQNRWMLGIMSALKQSKNSSKLGHFRYSLGELPQAEDPTLDLQRHSSTEIASPLADEKQSSSTVTARSNESIIQRLQKIGAQTYYGGNMATINQISNFKRNGNYTSDEPLHSPIGLISNNNGAVVENKFENVSSKIIHPKDETMFTKNIYEKISRDSIESNGNHQNNNCCTPHTNIDEKEVLLKVLEVNSTYEPNILRRKSNELDTSYRPSLTLENEVYITSEHNAASQNKTRKVSVSEAEVDLNPTFLLENEPYAAHTITTKQKNKDYDYVSDRPSTYLLENETYNLSKSIITQKRYKDDMKTNFDIKTNLSSEGIYTEPKYAELIDHNKNNVLNIGQQLINMEDNAYSVIKLCDSSVNKTNNAAEYEYLDVAEYVEVKEPENGSSNYSSQKNEILKKNKKKNRVKSKTNEDEKEVKLKKSSSFIRRVWKKKEKNKETKAIDNDENFYESVPAAAVEKVCLTDNTAIQMLSELHNILENKKPILTERFSGESITSKHDEKKTDNEYVQSANNSGTDSDETAVQMLTELQNILECKKNILTARMSIAKDETKTSTIEPETLFTESEMTQKNPNKIDIIEISSGSERERPRIPPKSQKGVRNSPYHDILKNNQPTHKVVPPKKKRNCENVKSLDEILDDLEQEKNESCKNKVKKLIKRFSETDFNDDDVVLRNNQTVDYSRDIDTDELNRLLDELAKVTCAPILTPGVTTSLINPNLTDEELLKLIPKHRRRYSEPDYDIPRPHKSLASLPRREISAENAIGSTRFFGPILKPSDISIKSTKVKDSTENIPSMTPDSLEVDALVTCPQQLYFSEDEKNLSYTSHDYAKLRSYNSYDKRHREEHKYKNIPSNIDNSLVRFDDIIIENDIYALPKSLHDVNLIREHKNNDNTQKSYLKGNKQLDMKFEEENELENEQENFVDSLEMCNSEN